MNAPARKTRFEASAATGYAPGYLNEYQAAAYSGRSVASLRKDRFEKRGFPYVKLGTRVFYRREDIDQEMSRHLVMPKSA